MTIERYEEWIAVWKWFQEQPRSGPLERLYDQLNEMWQQDRSTNTPDQLKAYSKPFRREDDPEFKKFLDDMNRGFRS